MTLKIWHLSDLHLSAGKKADQDIVVQALNEKLAERVAAGNRPDIVVFSGDLVQAGSTNAHFRDANSSFVAPLLATAGVSRDNFFICPGNHDIDREYVRKNNWEEKGLLTSLRSRDEINSFIDTNAKGSLKNALPSPFNRLDHFYQTIWKPMAKGAIADNPLLIAKRLKVRDNSIGICLFNTAWRCTGEPDNADRGNLILGERIVDQAIKAVATDDFRIAVLHHPFDWLRDEDRAAVESRMHEGFDIVLFGHVHRSSPETRLTAFGGLVYSQAGCLYQHRDYYNGYSEIEVDIDASRARIRMFEYDDRPRKFDISQVVSGGELEFDIEKIVNGKPSLKTLLARTSPHIRRLGNEHITFSGNIGDGFDIERNFICPPLAQDKRTAEFLALPSDEKQKDVTELLHLSDNLIVGGGNEAGKTSLAHYLALKTARGNADELRLPLVSKFSDFKLGRDTLWRAIKAYANEIGEGRISSTTLTDFPTLIIVDDVDPRDAERFGELLKCINDFPLSRWILLTSEHACDQIVRSLPAEQAKKSKAFNLRPLPRKSIRVLSARWLNAEEEAELTDETFRMVMEQIRRTGLPRTGYMVSLILWTLRNASRGEILNEAVLLGNILDYILGRMDYSGSLRSEFDFVSKSQVLQHLAVWMKSLEQTPTKNEVVGELVSFFKQKGLPYDAAEVVAGFLRCGVFGQVGEQLEFRHRRFREYFVSSSLKENPSHLDEIISGKKNWKDYRRELDLYTSRFRNETRLLHFGRSLLEGATVAEAALRGDGLIEYIAEGSNAKTAIKRIDKVRKNPMTAAKIDLVQDRAEEAYRRRQKTFDNKKSNQPATPSSFPVLAYVDALELYSHIVRNLEFADSDEKREHLKRCLEGWVEMTGGVLSGIREVFIDINADIAADEEFDPEAREEVIKILKDFEIHAKGMMPAIISSVAYHNVASEKLASIFDEIVRDGTNGSLLRVLAVSILLELSPKLAMDRILSSEYRDQRRIRWVNEVLEARFYAYYMDRLIPDTLRSDFLSVLADLEVSISGNGRNKGAIIQALEKDDRKREAQERKDDDKE